MRREDEFRDWAERETRGWAVLLGLGLALVLGAPFYAAVAGARALTNGALGTASARL